MLNELHRRDFLQTVSAGAAALSIGGTALAGKSKIVKKTYTYKTVGKLEIKADVYRADDNVVRPVAIWIHGGALIMGSRAGVSNRVKEALLGDGYVLVSIDYRLAPETQLAEIVGDVEDAYRWVHEKGPELFNADTKRIAVLGGSAGGYLTLTAGIRATPRPAVLVAFWGYGDLVGDWYSKPSEFYRRTRPLVKKDDAMKIVGGAPVTDGSINSNQRRAFYLYCRQNGVWPQLVSGFDPIKQANKFAPFEPVRGVTKEYPPTLLIHGTVDTDVPYEQSVLMEKQFKQHNVPHKFVTVPNAGHGLSKGDPRLINDAYAQVLPFVNKYMKPK
jgi:acetyl esterase/lipase